MELLLNIGLLAGIVFLMMKFGCGGHIAGPVRGDMPSPLSNTAAGEASNRASEGPPSAPRRLIWVAPEKDVDPVCGKTITTRTARSSVHAGEVFYFCSRDCREIFEAAPDTYLGATPTPKQPRQLEKSHV